ncbi:hypothetical protein D3C72_1886650 [compost metagenome]
MSWSSDSPATLACCQRLSTCVTPASGASMRVDKIDAATSTPVLMWPSITSGAPKNTTKAKAAPCTVCVQLLRVLSSARSCRPESAFTAL